MTEPLTITLYTKPGCHLCEDTADLLEDLLRFYPFVINLIDITTEIDLFGRYWDKIPVLDIAGTTIIAPIEREQVRAVIAQATRNIPGAHA